MKKSISLCTASMVMLAGFSSYGQKDLKTYSKVLEDNQEEYTINTAGTLEPENTGLVIENIGEEMIVNPRITINDKWNWSTVESIVREIIHQSSAVTGEEKAMAIWIGFFSSRKSIVSSNEVIIPIT